MKFSLPEAKLPAQLASSPLRLALVQARTAPVLAFEQPAEVQRLLAALAGRWTITDRQTNRQVALSLGPGAISEQVGTPETVWVLTHADGSIRAALGASSVAVEIDRYGEWADFDAAIRDIFGAVADTFAPARCTRLGVRYINELQDARAGADAAALGELVNADLIAPALRLGRPLLGSLAELRVAGDDDGGVFVLRHGLTSPGVYLLDFDAYREHAEPFDAARLAERAGVFHAAIEAAFVWSIAEPYLRELRDVATGAPAS